MTQTLSYEIITSGGHVRDSIIYFQIRCNHPFGKSDSGDCEYCFGRAVKKTPRGLFMFDDAAGFKRIFLKVGYTNLRKGIPCLMAMIVSGTQ